MVQNKIFRSIVKGPIVNYSCGSRVRQFHPFFFCCVDDINTRQMIWDTVKDKVELFVDGRMSAETFRMITAADEATKEYYPKTLFVEGEAYEGACTAKSTIYCSNVVAGFMVSQLTKVVRKIPIDPDISMNLLSMEMFVGNPEEAATQPAPSAVASV